MKKFYDVIWRFCVACSVIFTMIGLSIAITNSNYTSINYRVYSIDIKDRLQLDLPCPSNSANKYFDYKTKSGKTAYVNLCFLSTSFTKKDGTEVMLVPFKQTKEGTWGDTPYSQSVLSYTENASIMFKMTKEEEKAFENKYWSNKWASIGEAVGTAIALNAIFWALFYVMVWVFIGNKKTAQKG